MANAFSFRLRTSRKILENKKSLGMFIYGNRNRSFYTALIAFFRSLHLENATNLCRYVSLYFVYECLFSENDKKKSSCEKPIKMMTKNDSEDALKCVKGLYKLIFVLYF